MTRNSVAYCLCTVAIAAMLGAARAHADDAMASNPAAIIPDAATSTESAQPIATMGGQNLIGREVTGAGDQPVGEIESVYVDAKGNVNQIILTGGEDHAVAIAWKDVLVTEAGKKIAIAASRDQLMRMPQYHYARPEQQGTAFTDDDPGAARSR